MIKECFRVLTDIFLPSFCLLYAQLIAFINIWYSQFLSLLIVSSFVKIVEMLWKIYVTCFINLFGWSFWCWLPVFLRIFITRYREYSVAMYCPFFYILQSLNLVKSINWMNKMIIQRIIPLFRLRLLCVQIKSNEIFRTKLIFLSALSLYLLYPATVYAFIKL